MLLSIINSITSDPELAVLPQDYYDQEKYEIRTKVKFRVIL